MKNSVAVDEILSHHGIKGMKWGVRKRTPTPVTVTQKGKKLQVTGGQHQPASADAIAAKAAAQKAKKSGPSSLSNQEMQALVTRMNLEQNMVRLKDANKQSKMKKGNATVKQIVEVGKTANEVNQFLHTPMGKLVRTELGRGARKGVSRAIVKTGRG